MNHVEHDKVRDARVPTFFVSAQLPHPLPRSSVWFVTLTTVAIMVRNVIVSGLMAFLTGFFFSSGNVFSGRPSARQSRVEFMAAAMLWTQLLAVLAMIAFLSGRLAHTQQSKHSILYWSARMLQGTLVPYTIVASILIVFVWICHHFVPARLDYLRLEYYIEVFLNQLIFALCDARARQLYRTETIQGRERSTTTAKTCDKKSSAFVYVVRAYMASIPTHATVVIASVYVHLVSHSTFVSSQQINLFVGGSLLFKLTIQELIKKYLLTRGRTNLRIMCVMVGVPTVIIETQVRVVILTVANVQSSVMGTYLIAATEILLRCGKVLWLRLSIYRRQRRIVVPADILQFHEWKLRHVQYHTAETLADMYAEYIAIACSAAIAALWSGNPQYMVRLQHTTSLWTKLAWQTGLEVCVDYVSCVIEISAGATVDTRGNGIGTFLGFVCVMLVIINMHITAMLYIHSR